MIASVSSRLAWLIVPLGLLWPNLSSARSSLPSLEVSLERSESNDSERTASPLDAWIHPYGLAWSEASWPRYDYSTPMLVGIAPVPTSVDWWSSELTAGRRFRFADPQRFVLLRRYTQSGRERMRPASLIWSTRLDPERFRVLPELDWHIKGLDWLSAPNASQLAAIAPLALPAMKQRKCPAWSKPISISVTSWGNDYDRLSLFDCDGNIAVDALDRVSALARVFGKRRPELPLPDAPNVSEDWPEEWVEGVRLLHPRLLWLLQRIGEAFPKRTIHLMSGYRRDARDSSPHRQGRALDIAVRGVTNEQLFAYCRSLADVGCGYYPYHPFVHFDVRPVGTPHAHWVDASHPGERSKYVDAWPGVIENGAVVATDADE